MENLLGILVLSYLNSPHYELFVMGYGEFDSHKLTIHMVVLHFLNRRYCTVLVAVD